MVVDMGSVKTTGTSTDTVNLEAEYKSKTNYVVSLSQSWTDWCGFKNGMISFDLTIIDSTIANKTISGVICVLYNTEIAPLSA